MTDCVRSKLSRIVTQINDDEFLIEGYTDFARFSFEIDDTYLSLADIQGGPVLQIGCDFFGKGKIKSIEKVQCNEDTGYFMFKINIIRG